MMTRRGYKDMAEEIRFVYDRAEDADKVVIRHIVRTISGPLKRDNSRFDREKFIYAATGE